MKSNARMDKTKHIKGDVAVSNLNDLTLFFSDDKYICF